MTITFTPALGETINISTPSSIFIDFEAILSRPLNQGERLQLWSNLPIPGLSPGDWGAQDLVPRGGSAEKLALRADCPLELRGHSTSQKLSFTYRLVRPSGHIEWLGQYGQNGRIVIRKDLEAMDLPAQWNTCEPHVRVLSEVETDSPVLKVPNSWKILPISANFDKIALVPPQTNLASTRTLMLSSTCPLKYDPSSGNVFTTSRSSLRLECLAQEHSTLDIKPLSPDTQYGYILAGSPGKLAAIPISIEKGSSKSITIDIAQLIQNSCVPNSTQEVVVWSTDSVEYLGPSRPVIDLALPVSGAIFTTYIPHDINDSKVFIPADAHVTAREFRTSSLPTPPPSPPGKPAVLPSSHNVVTPRKNPLVLRQKTYTWLQRLLRRLVFLLLSLIGWVVMRRNRRTFETRKNSPEKTTPVETKAIPSPATSERTKTRLIVTNIIQPIFEVLIPSKESKLPLDVFVTDKGNIPLLQNKTIQLPNLGDMAALTYDVGESGVVCLA